MPRLAVPDALQLRGEALEQQRSLLPGQGIRSANGRFVLCLRQDGVVGVWRGEEPLWASDTPCQRPPARLTLQRDGNLVALDAAGEPYWASGTSGTGQAPYRLLMQSDGNAVIYSSRRAATWDTGTWKHGNAVFKGSSLDEGCSLAPGEALRSSDGRFTFIFQTDANVVLYEWANPLWASDTWNHPNPRKLVLQADGNLVAYSGRAMLVRSRYWSSNTAHGGAGPHRLVMRDDGNAVLLTGTGTVTWQTHTRRSRRAHDDQLEREESDTLLQNGTLLPGQGISCGEFRFSLKVDAEIVLWRGDLVLWSSETRNKCTPGHLIMQTDGNLVAYDVDGNPYWASDTWNRGSAPFKVVLQADGNCVLYDRRRSATWDTGTWKTARVTVKGNSLPEGARLAPDEAIRSIDGRYTFVLQTDANLVVYHWTDPLWASNTYRRCIPSHAVVGSDGKFESL